MKTRRFESAWQCLSMTVKGKRAVSSILATALCGMSVTVGFAFAQSWQPTDAPNTHWASLASSADGKKLVAVAQSLPTQALIYASTNSGASWFLTGAPSNSWTSVASSADGINLVATCALIWNPAGGGAHGGPVYTSTDSGATWQPTTAPSNQWSSVASSADGSILVAAAAYNNSNTAYGLIFISTNSGASWHASGAPTNYWYSVAASADGTKLIAGGRNNLFISTDSGTTWTPDSIPWDFQSAVPKWVSVASSADGIGLLAVRDLSTYYGDSGPRSYVSTNSGSTWTSYDLPHTGSGSVASSANGSRLMVSMGQLNLSTDSGMTWARQTIGGIYGYEWGCVACSADGGKLCLAIGADGYGRPSSVYTCYSLPEPHLNLAHSSSNVVLSWMVPSTEFIVQQNSDLTTTNWVRDTNAPTLILTTLHNQVILPVCNGSSFYRLATP
jgi:hypothetical protein